MENVSLIIVEAECGDWAGLYVNGILENEGHNISEREWIRLISKYRIFSGEIKCYSVSDDYIGERGNFPNKFSEIPNEYLVS